MANLVTSLKFIGSIQLDTSRVDAVTHYNNIITDNEANKIAEIFGDSSVAWIYENKSNETLNVFYNGGDFTYSGKSYRTKGLVTILAHFMYYNIVNDKYSRDTAIGTVRSDSESGIVMFDYAKLRNVWNDAAFEVEKLFNFILSNPSLFQSSIEQNDVKQINSFGI